MADAVAVEDAESDAQSSAGSDDLAIISAPPTPPPTTGKRKRGRPPKAAATEEEGATEGAKSGDTSPKITYTISVYSLREAAKAVSKRSPSIVSLSLGRGEPWDTLKAQLLVKIDGVLSPSKLDFDDYSIMFYIKYVIPKPGIALRTEEDYEDLLARVRNKAGKTAEVSLTVEEKKRDAEKENALPDGTAGSDSDDTEVTRKGKKTGKAGDKAPKKKPLKANVKKTNNIKLLQERWACRVLLLHIPRYGCPLAFELRQASTLGRSYGKIHLLDVLLVIDAHITAQLKDDDTATLEKPPVNPLFNPDPVARNSPVLQRRIDQQNAAKAVATSSAPVFNITVGDNVLDMLRPGATMAAPAVPVPVPAPPAMLATVSRMLLQPGSQVGNDMSIVDFCAAYDLSPELLQKLNANGYDKARNLRFVSLDDLDQMGFMKGERDALRDAVERWAV